MGKRKILRWSSNIVPTEWGERYHSAPGIECGTTTNILLMGVMSAITSYTVAAVVLSVGEANRRTRHLAGHWSV